MIAQRRLPIRQILPRAPQRGRHRSHWA